MEHFTEYSKDGNPINFGTFLNETYDHNQQKLYDFDKLKDFLREQNCPFIEDISDVAIMNGAAQIKQGREFGYAEYEIIDLTLGVLPSSIMARLILEFFDEGATEITSNFG